MPSAAKVTKVNNNRWNIELIPSGYVFTIDFYRVYNAELGDSEGYFINDLGEAKDICFASLDTAIDFIKERYK